MEHSIGYALSGAGVQVFLSSIVLLAFALLGFLSPANRGALLSVPPALKPALKPTWFSTVAQPTVGHPLRPPLLDTSSASVYLAAVL